jgi:hypothetical protein
MVLEHKGVLDKTLNKEQKDALNDMINRYQSHNNTFDSTGKEKNK